MRREDNPTRPNRDVTRPRLKPGQTWVCGYSDLGQCCRSGPTCDGRCGRTVVEGSLLKDEMEDAESDDTANVKLPPCIPRRSLAVRRQSLRLNVAILTGGLLMLCMTLPSREKIFVPGELSSKHAQILDNTVASQRCGLCHPTSHSSGDSENDSGTPVISALLSSAKRLIENDGRQDGLCMQCHKGHMPAAANRDPHDLSPEMWQRLQQTANTPWQLVSTRAGMDSSQELETIQGEQAKLSKTSCAMCHNEHHGRGFDIKLISDSRCQACHQKQFESLASGHPEFKDFPVDRPRGLAFSHTAHAQDHFPKKNRDFDCKACHLSATGATSYVTATAGSSDLVRRSLSFEHACASCHEQPIRAATVDGWAALQLPSIEADDATGDSALANWPGTARYGYDGVVSPVMRALLMADPQALPALEKLPPSGKIVELSNVAAVRANVARSLAAATKRLLEETARDGQAAWVTRLQKVTRAHLDRELTSQHETLITVMVAGLPPDLFRHVETQWFGATIPLAQDDVQGDRGRGRLISAAPRKQQATPPTNDKDDLLVDPNGSDELLLGAAEPNAKQPMAKAVKGATHLTGGGWYADQTTMSIRYMPTGHADATLAAWAMWWSVIESHKPVLPTGDAERIARQLTMLPSNNSPENRRAITDWIPGNCSQCHQMGRAATKLVSTVGPNRLADHYQVPERDPSVREFTKFQHSPHLTLPALSDCRYCHQDKQPQPTSRLTSLTSHDPSSSEFATLKVSQCAACHRPNGANDRCVQCHNYHVNEVGSRE